MSKRSIRTQKRMKEARRAKREQQEGRRWFPLRTPVSVQTVEVTTSEVETLARSRVRPLPSKVILDSNPSRT